jgi:hypothetical protein
MPQNCRRGGGDRPRGILAWIAAASPDARPDLSCSKKRPIFTWIIEGAGDRDCRPFDIPPEKGADVTSAKDRIASTTSPSFSESDIRDKRLKEIYAYWKGKAGMRRMPARRDLDPIEMKEWLGNLMLVDFPTGKFIEFRYRLEGINIEQFYDARRTGRGVEAMTAESERKSVLPQWEVVFDQGRPAYYESDIWSSEGKLARQIKLLLPLSDDGEHVNMILGAIYFRPRFDYEKPA